MNMHLALTARLADALAELDSLAANANTEHHAAADRRESHSAARWLGRTAAYTTAAGIVRAAMAPHAIAADCAHPVGYVNLLTGDCTVCDPSLPIGCTLCDPDDPDACDA